MDKKKYEMHEKLKRFKQITAMILMIMCGIWYVTSERKETGISFVSEQQANAIIYEETGVSEGKAVTDINDQTDFPDDVQKKNNTGDNVYEEASRETEENESEDVLEETEIALPEEAEVNTEENSSLVNLNKASLQELDSLPGVGPSTAQNIIDYRNRYGGFADIEEIKNVKRIGDKTFEKLKNYITVR
ncbi:ComEA family DNA-binding protein [Oribacterium sp. WCC10]|uniref:ComEA family DNA-binding protein n=1 Tax=Oribacterium sp. WCC10 TaxID=1855343 RepID=UPI0008EC756F|nr:helix-hairpin-helix domain-containing protein [Oribacterium sp. WCC10]SFG21267.1 competence protein ComEA [Oribacterium sp. WCC10]